MSTPAEIITPQIDSKKYIDIKKLASMKGAKAIWCNGFSLTTDDLKLQTQLNKWCERNDFIAFGFMNERIIRELGRSIITLDYNADKTNIIAGMGVPFFINESAKATSNTSSVNSEIAVVWKQEVLDLYSFWTRTVYTRKKAVRQYTKRTLISSGKEVDLGADYLLSEESTYDLEFVPVVDMINQPYYNYTNTDLMNGQPDNYHVYKLEVLINHILTQIYKEAVFNRTRVFGNFKIGTDLTALTSEMQELIGDFLIQMDLTGVENAAGRAVEILKGDPNFGTYAELVDYLIDLYMYNCGLSFKNNDGGAIKTAQEVMVNKGNEAESIAWIRKWRNKQFTNFFDKLIVMLPDNKYNCLDDLYKDDGTRVYKFEINDQETTMSLQEKEMYMQEFNNGLLTKQEYIEKTRGLNSQDAKKVVEQINKEVDERNEKMADLQNNYDDNQDASQGQNGGEQGALNETDSK